MLVVDATSQHHIVTHRPLKQFEPSGWNFHSPRRRRSVRDCCRSRRWRWYRTTRHQGVRDGDCRFARHVRGSVGAKKLAPTVCLPNPRCQLRSRDLTSPRCEYRSPSARCRPSEFAPYTPDIFASAPYTKMRHVIVDAPLRPTERVMLIAPSAFTGMPRRPSISTRLRFAPRPRGSRSNARSVVALAARRCRERRTAGTNSELVHDGPIPTDIVLSNALPRR